MVTEALPAEVRAKLAAQYPGKTVTGLVLESGARPKSAGAGARTIFWGILLFVPLGLVFLGAWLMDRRQRRSAEAALAAGGPSFFRSA
jgi:hypothetical protein